MTHVVLRPGPGLIGENGEPLRAGELVDTSFWKRRALARWVDRHYLAPLTIDTATAAAQALERSRRGLVDVERRQQELSEKGHHAEHDLAAARAELDALGRLRDRYLEERRRGEVLLRIAEDPPSAS